MEGSLKIGPNEFNIHLFEKLQRMFQAIGPQVITISFSGGAESKTEKENRLLTAREALDQGMGQTFTMEELEAFLKS